MSFNFGDLLDEDFSNVMNRLKGEVDDGDPKIIDSTQMARSTVALDQVAQSHYMYDTPYVEVKSPTGCYDDEVQGAGRTCIIR
jgi:hypothetical protein